MNSKVSFSEVFFFFFYRTVEQKSCSIIIVTQTVGHLTITQLYTRSDLSRYILLINLKFILDK